MERGISWAVAAGAAAPWPTLWPIRVRAVMKPLPSLSQPLESVNMATREPVMALKERSDVCAVPAAAVVAEAVVMLALMNPFLEKFGGDSISEMKRNYEGYVKQLKNI